MCVRHSAAVQPWILVDLHSACVAAAVAAQLKVSALWLRSRSLGQIGSAMPLHHADGISSNPP